MASNVGQRDAACRKAILSALQCEGKAPCGDTRAHCARAYVRVADACPEASGSDTRDAGAATPPPPSRGASDEGETCEECIVQACRSELTSCTAAATCSDFLECGAECDDSRCVSECGEEFPDGQRAYQPLSRCIASKCASSCGDT